MKCCKDRVKCSIAPGSPLSSLEVVLPHWNVLNQTIHLLMTHICICVRMCVCVCTDRERFTYSCVDLAVVCGHAVSMVEVGEGLGSAPGLQVPGHSDRRPHLPTVQRGTRAQTQQRAVPLSLRKATGTEKDTGD